MDWNDRIFRYCERGDNPAFWAEPLNAATNAAFIIAAILVLAELIRRPPGSRGLAEAGLVAVMFMIGVGSFMFHTFATRWASYADTGPIGIFMLAYLAYALRRFMGLNWVLVGVGLAVFIASLRYAGAVTCNIALVSIVEAARHPCLNGTAGYVPALAAMAVVALAAAAKGHPSWRYLATGAAIFAVSMVARTIDWEICSLTEVGGHRLGTHFLWHLLNATMLYMLVHAAILHGGSAQSDRRGRAQVTQS
jgi:hypothetical protein